MGGCTGRPPCLVIVSMMGKYGSQADNGNAIRNGRDPTVTTILVVDDEPPMREVLQVFLRESGHHVLTSDSGEDAVKICYEYEETIDVMVTDLSMPGIDGVQLAKLVRQIRPNVKVVVSSAVSRAACIGQAGLSENAVFLKKPFPLPAMESAIQDILTTDTR